MSHALLQAEDLKKKFSLGLWRRRTFDALRGVDFEIFPGKCLGVVGESGSGKTTLGRICIGAVFPTSGRVNLEGRDVRDLDRRRHLPRLTQMIFQDSNGCLNPMFKVRDLLLEPLRIQKQSINTQSVLKWCLDQAMLNSELLDRRPHQLSGGQRQRVALARALALDPKILVADEPAASLDRSIQASLLSTLLKRKQETGMGILLISHDIRLVRLLADEMAVMYKGLFVEQGPAKLLLDQPLHPYTNKLFAAVPGERRAKYPDSLSGSPNQPEPGRGCPFRPHCSRALPQCTEAVPEMREVDEGQRVRCHVP
ncbi:MAG: ABC transporter ATP-binding protein [Desulfonatronovibrionaceae bacterium]